MHKAIIKKIIKNNTPRWIVLLIDIYLVINTFILAYFIRFNFDIDFDRSQFSTQIPFVIIAALIGFLIIGSYKGIIRHTGVKDSLNIFFASTITLGILMGIVFLNRYFSIIADFTIPVSILVIHFLLNVVVLISSRYIFKALFHLLITSDYKIEKRVMIYGAGEAGLLTYSVLQNDNENKVQIVGFLDDNKRKFGKRINNLKVYNPAEIDKDFIKNKKINEIIISIQRVKPSRLIEMVDNLALLSVNVKIVPPAKSWIDNDLKAQQIQTVKIEDLLGRDPIELNNAILQKELNDKVVLITGAAGSIGSEIARQVALYNYKQLILLDQAESDLYDLQQELIQGGNKNFEIIVADVRGEKRMTHIFEKFKPNFVFHAAAYKHVPLMENNPYEAVNVNVFGTKILAELAIKNNVDKFVMISTDKAVNPTNVMGATKRVAEMYISCLKGKGTTKFITTRFGNVLGSNGSVIPLFKRQIEKGGPLTVTHKDITRYFMTIPEACQLVLEAGAMGNGGEIYVFDMGESIKIYDLALNMIHLSGLKFPEDIDIKITGLRPGEKIYEELLGDGENTIPTYHKKIMIAKTKSINSPIIKEKVDALCLSNKEINFNQTVTSLKEIVPEYVSNNSEYEVLDSVKV